MKLGLKILLSLEVAVCLMSLPLTALEDGNQYIAPARRPKRFYRAPLHASIIPLEESAAPQQPVAQNYTGSLSSPPQNSKDDGAFPSPQGDKTKAKAKEEAKAQPKQGIKCVIL